MNRPVWSSPSPLSGCDAIEPLLPLYADGFASPAEIRLVDTHLPDCAGCRASLTCIQATHAALASRPIAVPPPDLHSRIALAIAASPAAPVRLRPARVFSLRPAYAAAASLTAIGIALGISYPLWHLPAQVAVKPAPRPTAVATVPAAVKSHSLPTVKRRTLIASRPPKTNIAKLLQAAHKALPVPSAPPERVANNALPNPHPIVRDVAKTLVHRFVPGNLVVAKVIKKIEKNTVKLPEPKQIKPKGPDSPLMANVSKEPPRIRVDIKPPTTSIDPPLVQTVSAHDLPSSDSILGDVNAHFKQKWNASRNASFVSSGFTVRKYSQGAVNMMHTVDSESATNIVDIHTP